MNEAGSEPIGGKAAEQLIEPLTDLVIRAGEAILAVNRAAMKIDNGRHQLVRMEMTAERILERLGAHQPGRPREGRAERIASAAASVFERLTGKPSTLRYSEGVAYGPFLDFLKAVFKACRITASAEAQAKAVRRKHHHPP